MGIEHAMFALASIIGPIIGTYSFKLAGISGLGLVCALIFAVVLSIWLIYAPSNETLKIEKVDEETKKT